MSAEDRHETDLHAELRNRLLARWPLDQWQNDVLLLAVSGGADSMALLNLIVGLAPDLDRIKVVHVNHGLRGAESDADEDFVLEQCIEYGVECLSVRIDQDAVSSSSEDSLRKLRYAAFVDSARAVDARWVVLAHHQDDNIETFLIRLLRGTGLRGLKGIPFTRDVDSTLKDCKFVRPLLDVPRALIEAWFQQSAVSFREDSSNETDVYLRNRIRQGLVPSIDAIGIRDWREKVAQLLDEINARNDSIGEDVKTILASGAVTSLPLGGVRFPLALFSTTRWEIFREFLVEIWLKENWPQQQLSRKHWLIVQELLSEALLSPHPKGIDLPGQIRFEVKQKTVRVFRAQLPVNNTERPDDEISGIG